MEQNREVIFEVMITFPHLLDKVVKEYNDFFSTNFEVIEVVDDEVPFCKIKATQYKLSDIFDLGYSLAAKQYRLKANGELDW